MIISDEELESYTEGYSPAYVDKLGGIADIVAAAVRELENNPRIPNKVCEVFSGYIGPPGASIVTDRTITVDITPEYWVLRVKAMTGAITVTITPGVSPSVYAATIPTTNNNNVQNDVIQFYINTGIETRLVLPFKTRSLNIAALTASGNQLLTFIGAAIIGYNPIEVF